MARVSISIFTRAAVQVATTDLVGSDSKSTWWIAQDVLDEIDDLGFLQLNVQADATNVTNIATGHIVVVSRDASPVWRGTIKKRTWHEVGTDEAGRYAEFDVVGEVMGRLDEFRLYPVGGLGRFPFGDEVQFNWTHPDFDDSGWSAAVETPANYGESTENYGLPEGLPYGTAEWIWDQDSSGTVPGGVKYFRKSATVSTQAVYEAWGAADDQLELWLDGLSILKSSEGPYVGACATPQEMLTTTGSRQFAARAENLNELKAGLVFGFGRPRVEGDTPVVVTDDTWLVAPADPELGMNPGQILTLLRTEGIARGEDWPALTCSATLDSDGNAWTVYDEITAPLGENPATPGDVLRQMVELGMCEFRPSATGYSLDVFNPNTGSTVVYSLTDTDSLTKLDWVTEGVQATVLLVRWARGYVEVEDAAAVAAHGRIVAPLSLGGVQSESAAISIAGKVLSRFKGPRTQISAAFDPSATTDEPWTKYSPRQFITVPGPSGASAQKVLAVTMGLDEAGNPTWGAEFGDRIEEMERRQRVILQRLAGSVGGRSQSSSVPFQPRAINPPAPQELDWSWAGSIATGIGARKGLSRAVRIREFRMELEGTISGTYTARLLKNGTAVTGSSVSLTAAGQKYVTLGEVMQQRPAGYCQPEITAVGSGATRITLTVVYA